MIVALPAKPGSSVERIEAIENACALLLAFATPTNKSKQWELEHLKFKFFEYSSPEHYQDIVERLADKVGDRFIFRNYYNKKGQLTAVTCSNFAWFLPPKMSGWTFVDDMINEEFPGRLN